MEVHAYSLRQFSNRDGLSNSAILSLYQDDRGIIWIGSCDGMNIFDGTDIHLYTPINSSKTLLSGNLINQIIESEKDILWVQTNYGLNRLDTKQQTSQSFTEFKGQYFMANNKDDMLLFWKMMAIFIIISEKHNLSIDWKFPILNLAMYSLWL